jgi:hypothetical protein
VIDVREATETRCISIAERMRQQDRAEVEAGGFSPLQAILESQRMSIITECALVDGVPAAVWGVVPRGLLSSYANVWMLGTDMVPQHRKALLRLSRAFIARVSRLYPFLDCLVDSRYTEAIRWVEWLGFKPRGVQSVGDVPFFIFDRRA